MGANHINIIGRLSLVALGVVGIALLNPSSPTTSYATDNAGGGRAASGASAIALSLGGQADIEVLPTATGSFAASSADLIILATNTVDYRIYISPIDGANTSLVPMDASNEHSIATISESASPSSFPANTWGYSLAEDVPDENTLYQPLVSGADPVKEVATEADTTDRYKLSFGVKVDTTLPSGFYTNKVMASVVATPVEVTKTGMLSTITYMQEMTPEICEGSVENETKQLIDSRDGKSYWVAKLKDGNCWMTQNLALDLDTNEAGNAVAVSESGSKVELDGSNTDISGVWKPDNPSKFKTNAIKLLATDSNAMEIDLYSWSWGKVVLSLPFRSAYGCGRIKSSDNLGEICRGAGVIDVSSDEWKPIFQAHPGSFDDVDYPLVAVDEENHVYDAHYLVGNYYQYSTATAGTGTLLAVNNSVAPGSICSRGWMLPASARNNSGQPIINADQSKASFYQLLLAYGYPESGYSSQGGISIPDLTGVVEDNPASMPIYIARSGMIYLNSGSLSEVSYNGKYWSSSATIANAFTLRLGSSLVAIDYSNRYNGLSVRCVAR